MTAAAAAAPTTLAHQSATEFVTFAVADQSFCLEITKIREIRRWVPVTALPHSPSDVLGVMNLRGMVIPIIDLGARFGLGLREPNPRNVVIVVATDTHTVGLVVESVSEILAVPEDQIQDAPDIQSSDLRRSIRGLIATEGGMTRVIDLDSVLDQAAGSLS